MWDETKMRYRQMESSAFTYKESCNIYFYWQKSDSIWYKTNGCPIETPQCTKDGYSVWNSDIHQHWQIYNQSCYIHKIEYDTAVKCVKHLHISTQMSALNIILRNGHSDICGTIHIKPKIHGIHILCIYCVWGCTLVHKWKKCMEAINIKSRIQRCLLGEGDGFGKVDTQVSLHCSLYILFMFNIASSKDYGHCKLLSPQVDLECDTKNNHSV